MNKFSAYGRMVRDPELKAFSTKNNPDGAVVSFTIAVRDGKDEKGEPKAQFIPCQAWNNTARFICEYIKKGDPIGVTGKLVANNWKDNDDQMHYGWIINIDEAECILDPTAEAQEPEPKQETRSNRQYNRSGRR